MAPERVKARFDINSKSFCAMQYRDGWRSAPRVRNNCGIIGAPSPGAEPRGPRVATIIAGRTVWCGFRNKRCNIPEADVYLAPAHVWRTNIAVQICNVVLGWAFSCVVSGINCFWLLGDVLVGFIGVGMLGMETSLRFAVRRRAVFLVCGWVVREILRVVFVLIIFCLSKCWILYVRICTKVVFTLFLSCYDHLWFYYLYYNKLWQGKFLNF